MPFSYIIAEPETTASSTPVARRAFGLPDDGFVYCSFNSAYKVEPRTFNVWMKILSRVPGSVLWLYFRPILSPNNSCILSFSHDCVRGGTTILLDCRLVLPGTPFPPYTG
ncbi:MAG: hypothetical protein ACLQIB_09705 [Isosphaeraceae bacterium]